MEKYFEYEGFPCIVHDDGVIESVDRMNWEWQSGSGYIRKGRVLKPDLTNQGYHRVTLGFNGKTKRVGVHRLVAFAYIPNPENKPFINHIDCNPLNNHVSNLEWCTNSENMLHALRLGRLGVSMKKLADCNEQRKKPVYFRGEYYESIGAARRAHKVESRVVHREGTFIEKEVEYGTIQRGSGERSVVSGNVGQGDSSRDNRASKSNRLLHSEESNYL